MEGSNSVPLEALDTPFTVESFTLVHGVFGRVARFEREETGTVYVYFVKMYESLVETLRLTDAEAIAMYEALGKILKGAGKIPAS